MKLKREKQKKKNERETECASLEVSSWGLFRENGPQREQQEEMRHGAWMLSLLAGWFPILFSGRQQRLSTPRPLFLHPQEKPGSKELTEGLGVCLSQ